MDRFEYRTVLTDTGGLMGGKVDAPALEHTLNNMGQDGWELVSAVATAMGEGATRHIVSIFKRRIEED